MDITTQQGAYYRIKVAQDSTLTNGESATPLTAGQYLGFIAAADSISVLGDDLSQSDVFVQLVSRNYTSTQNATDSEQNAAITNVSEAVRNHEADKSIHVTAEEKTTWSNNNLTVDQTYSATSTNPQSGVAVAQAVAEAGGGDCNVTITDKDSIVCGTGATTNGSGGCIAIGYNAQTKENANNNYTTNEVGKPWDSFSTSRNWTSVAYGAGTVAAARGVAVGGMAKAGSLGNMNYRGNTAVGFNAKAGVSADGATASGSYATASGSSATASGYSATASGYYATASGSYATASGYSATASGYSSVAIGAHCWNDTDGTTAVLAGFEPPTEENEYEAVQYQMQFFVKDGKPHIGFTKYSPDDCGGEPVLLESYAVDLSQLPHVAWTPPASRYTEDLDGNPVLKD